MERKKSSNYPPGTLAANNGTEFVAETVQSLMDLSNRGKPQSLPELKERINSYFVFCKDRALRPGIETLALSLSVSRQTITNWRKGVGCSEEWSEACQQAAQAIIAFIEIAHLSGRLNPATAIFCLKNWAHYFDQPNENYEPSEKKHLLGAEHLPKLGGGASTNGAEGLPRLES